MSLKFMIAHHLSYGIVVFEGAIPDVYCDEISQTITSSAIPAKRIDYLSAGYIRGTQYNEKLFQLKHDPEMKEMFIKHIQDIKRTYFSLLGLSDQEDISSFDDPIIKQYCVDSSDQFSLHFDSLGESRKRSLAMIWYLEDVNEGGETVFPHSQVSITPKKGNCLVFPPFWNYPHLARAPLDKDKLTLNSFGQVV